MTVRSHLLLPALALALTFAFAAPAAFADDTMSKDNMSKSTDSKMKSPTSGSQMSQTPDKPATGAMKKDGMSDTKSHDMGDGTSK